MRPHSPLAAASATAAALVAGMSGAAGQGEAETDTSAPRIAEDAVTQGGPKGDTNLSRTLDGDYATLTGTVRAVGEESFRLAHGGGTVFVEMDGWRWNVGTDPAAREPIRAGERVTVAGLVDGSFFKERRIEASSVFVPARQAFYVASPADEEGDVLPAESRRFALPDDDPATAVAVIGEVSAIEGRVMELDTGTVEIRVDTSALPKNPLDADGPVRVRTGDTVRAVGDLGPRLLEDGVMTADAIATYETAMRRDG